MEGLGLRVGGVGIKDLIFRCAWVKGSLQMSSGLLEEILLQRGSSWAWVNPKTLHSYQFRCNECRD